MSKDSVWLEKSGDRVLVDVGSLAEGHWRGLGYLGVNEILPDEPVLSDEKPVRKARTKKIADE